MMKTNYQKVNNLNISIELLNFVNDELLKDTDILPEKFWLGLEKAVYELAPKNQKLLEVRENLQKKNDIN